MNHMISMRLEGALIAQAGRDYPLRSHDQALLYSNLRIVNGRFFGLFMFLRC